MSVEKLSSVKALEQHFIAFPPMAVMKKAAEDFSIIGKESRYYALTLNIIMNLSNKTCHPHEMSKVITNELLSSSKTKHFSATTLTSLHDVFRRAILSTAIIAKL